MNPLDRFKAKKEEAAEERQQLEDEAMQQALESTQKYTGDMDEKQKEEVF